MNTDAMLSSMEAFLQSEEGQRSVEEFCKVLDDRYTKQDAELERFHRRFGNNLYDFIGKVVDKYQSEKYHSRYKYRECEDRLLWLLYHYAEKYGEELDPKNIALVDRLSMFTSEAYTLDGWLIERLDGQGSFISASKI